VPVPEPIEAIVPRRAQAFGEYIRRAAVLARAGLPLPQAYAVSRAAADAAYARVVPEPQRPRALLDPAHALPPAKDLVALRERVLADGVDAALDKDLRDVFLTLNALGAPSAVVSSYLVCDQAAHDRVLCEPRLDVRDAGTLVGEVARALAALYDPTLLRTLRAVGARDVSVAFVIRRMVDGLVAGVVYTRHPVTSDPSEWLLRAGFGLASGVRTAGVPSDVHRYSRDGFERDRVIAAKHQELRIDADGQRRYVDVPPALVHKPALTEAGIKEVLRLAERTEREVGCTVRVDWAISEGRIYLIHAEPLVPSEKAPKQRPLPESVRENALWSDAELGEAIPSALSPLGWSLLRRFSRVGLANVLSAAGAALGAAPELLMDVRGAAYLNLGVLTETVLHLPGMSPELLSALGIEVGRPEGARPRLGLLGGARAARRLYDAHVRFGDQLGVLSSRMADDRGHFAGLDARLLSPDAVERVLCDVEAFLLEVSNGFSRVYGAWLVTLLALRTLLRKYTSESEAASLEGAMLWGPGELVTAQVGLDFQRTARTLARDSRALAWADEAATPAPQFVREALDEFALRHRHQGMWLLDPRSPRWRETPARLEGAMRAYLGDPMATAFASERRDRLLERREGAVRAARRHVPVLLWPLLSALVERARTLTAERDKLLLDTAQAITVVREIAVDASRRLAMRHPDVGDDAAFYLDLDELHAALARGHWDVRGQIFMRRTEHGVLARLPRAVPRFRARPHDEDTHDGPLRGLWGSMGSAEGRVHLVDDADKLAELPRGAVLVVRACDVGLCAILPSVRAVIAEQGGPISHGAALAHALGVPVVVGVPNALTRLRAGERVRVDAEERRVHRTEFDERRGDERRSVQGRPS
jgi:rifampicin phosphotransferase